MLFIQQFATYIFVASILHYMDTIGGEITVTHNNTILGCRYGTDEAAIYLLKNYHINLFSWILLSIGQNNDTTGGFCGV